MARRPLRLAAALCCAALLAPHAATSGTKVDLSPYLGTLPQTGDFKVFRWSTHGQRTVTVTGVDPIPKGWSIGIAHDVTGTSYYDGPSSFAEFLIPGKQLLSGDEHYGNVSFVVAKPAKSIKLRTSLGKIHRTRKRAVYLLNDSPIGAMAKVVLWSAEGFETVVVPSGTYPNALRAIAATGLGFTDGSEVTIYLWSQTSWYAPGLGLVRSDYELELYEDGVLKRTESWTESLVSGVHLGVPFP